MYLNFHLDPILYLAIGVTVGYLAGRLHAWRKRKSL